LDCLANGEVNWYFQTVQSLPISQNTAIIFDKVKVEDSGVYFCYGLYDKDGDEHFLAKATLNVRLPTLSGTSVFNSIAVVIFHLKKKATLGTH